MKFTLQYWKLDGWYVGRLKEKPSVTSQGETLEELQTTIRDAFKLTPGDADEYPFIPDERQELAISL